MTTYLVTTELKTSWWMKFLRWLRIKPKRNEFKLVVQYNGYCVGQIITTDTKLLILRKLN